MTQECHFIFLLYLLLNESIAIHTRLQMKLSFLFRAGLLSLTLLAGCWKSRCNGVGAHYVCSEPPLRLVDGGTDSERARWGIAPRPDPLRNLGEYLLWRDRYFPDLAERLRIFPIPAHGSNPHVITTQHQGN